MLCFDDKYRENHRLFFDFWPFFLIDRTAEDETGNRLRERGGSDTQQKALRSGLHPRAAAARTKPLYMGRLLYPLSSTGPQSQAISSLATVYRTFQNREKKIGHLWNSDITSTPCANIGSASSQLCSGLKTLLPQITIWGVFANEISCKKHKQGKDFFFFFHFSVDFTQPTARCADGKLSNITASLSHRLRIYFWLSDSREVEALCGRLWWIHKPRSAHECCALAGFSVSTQIWDIINTEKSEMIHLSGSWSIWMEHPNII